MMNLQSFFFHWYQYDLLSLKYEANDQKTKRFSMVSNLTKDNT